MKAAGGREGLRSTPFLAPDQAELAAFQHPQGVEEREGSPERDEEAEDSDEEFEHLMRNIHHTMSLLDSPEREAMKL